MCVKFNSILVMFNEKTHEGIPVIPYVQISQYRNKRLSFVILSYNFSLLQNLRGNLGNLWYIRALLLLL